MHYRPILPRIVRKLAHWLDIDLQPFPEYVDLIVHVGQDGKRTELLRVHVDIDPDHKLCGTWPLSELHLVEEVERDNCA